MSCQVDCCQILISPSLPILLPHPVLQFWPLHSLPQEVLMVLCTCLLLPLGVRFSSLCLWAIFPVLSPTTPVEVNSGLLPEHQPHAFLSGTSGKAFYIETLFTTGAAAFGKPSLTLSGVVWTKQLSFLGVEVLLFLVFSVPLIIEPCAR